MVNWLLSILVIKGLMTEEEATHLSEELNHSIQPNRFKDALKIVKDKLKELE